MDTDHVGNRATQISAARSRQAFGAVLAQTGNQFAAQLAARLSIDGVENRFVKHVQARIVGKGAFQGSRDLVRRPLALAQKLTHDFPENRVGGELLHRPSGLPPSVAGHFGDTRAAQSVGLRVACKLPAHGRRRAVELAGDRLHDQAFVSPEIDRIRSSGCSC